MYHRYSRDFRLRQTFGWKFDNLNITIQQRRCEVLYTAGRLTDAVECFHEMMNVLGGETNLGDEIAMHVELADWSSSK